MNPDDLQLLPGTHELTLRLTFRRPDTDAFTTGKTILLRRPPIALVHGYNTAGDWGAGFNNRLAASRGYDFVKTIRYGQEPQDVSDQERETTVLRFGQLVPKLEQEFEFLRTEIAADGWAMTRFDVVAHSQGGVLTRMLCSQNANSFLDLPFRNPGNFYRGRFHRVITVGSPHNGTRLVSFMTRAASRLSLEPAQMGVARLISNYMISSGNSQPKFDPFGPDIRLLQSPAASAPWYPDAGAMFHLVATTVNQGQSPAIGSGTPSEAALGLTSLYGPAILPHGFDGVVDFDSQTATTPEAGQSPPPNSYRMPATQNISHALVVQAGVNIFGGDQGQVDSISVATHAIGALDQDPALPAQERVFGPFRLAIPLPPSVAANLDYAAENVSFIDGAIGYVIGPSPRDVISPWCQFTLPPGEVLAGPVTWSVERYGENGLTTEGVTLLSGGNPGRITVQIDRSVWGDVVLYGTARTASGRIIIGAPFVVESTVPDSETWQLDFLEIEPAEGSYPVGAGIEPVVWETWLSGDGGGETVRLMRFPAVEKLSVVGAPSHVMDVSDPLLWKATAPGSVNLEVTVQGVSASVQFTVYSASTNGVDQDGDGRSNSDESGVPNRAGGGTGDGNGDGTPDSAQWHVASVRGRSDRWLTITAASTSHNLSGVAPQPPPADTALLPEISAFDFGFLQFTIDGLTNGGSTVVTLFLPTSHEVTSLWAWGAEPGISGPHWFEFLHDSQTGGIIQPDRVLLHLTDGDPGDADGLANGSITTVPFSLTRFIPAPPQLNFMSGPGASFLLTWSATFPNSARTTLETSNDLGAWHFVPEIPQTAAGQNTLLLPADATRGYFRMRGF